MVTKVFQLHGKRWVTSVPERRKGEPWYKWYARWSESAKKKYREYSAAYQKWRRKRRTKTPRPSTIMKKAAIRAKKTRTRTIVQRKRRSK